MDSSSEKQEVLMGIIGRKVKGLVTSRWDGSIDIWRGFDELINKNGLNLRGHTAPIGDLSLT